MAKEKSKTLSFKKRKRKSGGWRSLWSRITVARNEYTCDHCHMPIFGGDLYKRTVIRCSSKSFFVERLHENPVCPVDPFEEERRIHEEFEKKFSEAESKEEAA